MESPVSYSYSRINQQKRLFQVPTRGNRISILGLWQPQQHFEYALAQGGFDGESYIKVMDWIAAKSALTLEQTGRLTVVVQDNSSIHKRVLRATTMATVARARFISVLFTTLQCPDESY